MVACVREAVCRPRAGRSIASKGTDTSFCTVSQLDDSVGALLKHLQNIGEAKNTIVIFTSDNGAEVFTWPDGGMTPFKATKGTVFEGGFRVPAIIRWAGKIKPGTIENGIFSGLDWLPTLAMSSFYFGGPHLGTLRIDDFKFQFYQQPQGWPGEKVTTDMPTIVNIRQDPFERTPSTRS
jgi:Sulfatase